MQIGKTALLVAAHNGHLGIVKELVDRGANVHAATIVSGLI